MIPHKKAVYQWCQRLDQLFVILFTLFACWVDVRFGLFFTGYVVVRAICIRIRDEENLIEELDREEHTGDTPEKSNHGPEYPGQ